MAPAWSSLASCDPIHCLAHRPPWPTSWDCNVAFEVDDVQAAVDWAATEGYGLVGGTGEYEGTWKMAYVRGPEGIIVSLAQRLD